MTLFADDFKKKLSQSTGLTIPAIETAWPDWWTDEAESSSSARNELRFSIARKLGLDPRSLSEGESPSFIWDGSETKYKSFSGDVNTDRPAISSFGLSVARILLGAVDTQQQSRINGLTAQEIRSSIVSNQPYVTLINLMSLAWGLGIPVIHVRVYPLSAKRMRAMAVKVGGAYAILLAHDSQYPSPLAFYLAHELAHIALGHVSESQALVDMAEFGSADLNNDPEEIEADTFALELLTGFPAPEVVPTGKGRNAHQLASECIRLSAPYKIEPGTLALSYGFSTGNWGTASKSLSYIYDSGIDAWKIVNSIANREISWEELSDDNESYLRAVLGGLHS